MNVVTNGCYSKQRQQTNCVLLKIKTTNKMCVTQNKDNEENECYSK